MNNQAIVLAGTLQKVRDLTRWYFSLLKDADPAKVWEVNGAKLNSVAWLAAHITWAENFLILAGTGGTPIDAPWLLHYKLGSDGTLHETVPDMKATLDLMKEVHTRANEHILTLSDEVLEQPNALNFGFGGDTTNRMLIQHTIRHEAMHTGHLSWLCKINGAKSV